LKNRSGQVVSPSVDTFRAAAAKANWTAQKFYVLLVDQSDKAAWPISSATFILIQSRPSNPGPTTAAVKFFEWALDKGDAQALALDYVPLPDATVSVIRQSWHQGKVPGF
jgi:phosphate transport system substrate-binding protein